MPAVQAASQATNGSSDGSEEIIRHRSYRIFKTERESLVFQRALKPIKEGE